MAKDAPTVSVIMPAYNTAPLIASSLESVFAQSFQDIEVIVVNDGSPDTVALRKALAPYLEKVVYIEQENKRAAGARNTGVRRARGTFVAFLDSDDVWFSGHLASQLRVFENTTDLDLVYCDCFAFSDPLRHETFMQRCPSRTEATFESLVVEDCQIPVSTVVARKMALQKAGLFDETLMCCDDYDMWLRVAFYGSRIAYSRSIQARLNEGRPGSLGTLRIKNLEANWAILDKIDRDFPLSDMQRITVRKRLTEVRGKVMLERAKQELDNEHFVEAKDLLTRANLLLHRSVLSLTRLALDFAPGGAGKLINFTRRTKRRVATAHRKRVSAEKPQPDRAPRPIGGLSRWMEPK